jgi:hypothetical protein
LQIADKDEPDPKFCRKVEYKTVPKQTDGYNCGMYVIAFARAIMRGDPLPDSYDRAINSSKDVIATIAARRQKYFKKHSAYETDQFDATKFLKQNAQAAPAPIPNPPPKTKAGPNNPVPGPKSSYWRALQK